MVNSAVKIILGRLGIVLQTSLQNNKWLSNSEGTSVIDYTSPPLSSFCLNQIHIAELKKKYTV